MGSLGDFRRRPPRRDDRQSAAGAGRNPGVRGRAPSFYGLRWHTLWGVDDPSEALPAPIEVPRASAMSSTLPDFADDLVRLDWVARSLYAAVLSDACDASGSRDRALRPDIRPLDESKVLVGRAKTAVWAPTFHVPPRPYDKEIAAVDSLQPGDVFVMAVGRSSEIVPWGELLSTATLARGGRGVVLDGLVRDSRQIRAMGLPVFCTGRRPYDSCGRGIVVDYDVPIALDGVPISPGDLVFGDADGVVIVPRAAEAEVLERAWAKVNAEDKTREALRAG